MAEAAEPPVQVVSIDALITESAVRYHVNREHLYKTLECESADFTVIKGQSLVKDENGPNGRENSWGMAQFHLPSSLTTANGKPVDMEVALDPEQAIDATAYNFSIGNAKKWSCYRLLY